MRQRFLMAALAGLAASACAQKNVDPPTVETTKSTAAPDAASAIEVQSETAPRAPTPQPNQPDARPPQVQDSSPRGAGQTTTASQPTVQTVAAEASSTQTRRPTRSPRRPESTPPQSAAPPVAAAVTEAVSPSPPPPSSIATAELRVRIIRVRYSVEFPEVDKVVRLDPSGSFSLVSMCAPQGPGGAHCLFRTMSFAGSLSLTVQPQQNGRFVSYELTGAASHVAQGPPRPTMGLGTPFMLGISEGPLSNSLQPFPRAQGTLDLPASRRAEVQLVQGIFLRLDRIGGPPEPPARQIVPREQASPSMGSANRQQGLPALPPLGTLPPLQGFRELGPVPSDLVRPR